MSAHAPVPGDARHNGVFFLAPDRFEPLDGEARDKGLCVCRADLLGCRDKADLLARLAVALRCPDSFGDNWDALADALRDLSWLPATGVALLCDHADALCNADGAVFATLKDVCRDAAHFRRAQGTAFFAAFAVTEPR